VDVATIILSTPLMSLVLSMTLPSKHLPSISIKALPGSLLEENLEKIIAPTDIF
jgi:hypothetical protein